MHALRSYLSVLALAAVTIVRGVAGQSETNSWGPITNQLQMSINVKANQRGLVTNEPVRLVIRLRNLTTNKIFHFYQPGAVEMSSAFSFRVISPSGKDISPKMQEPLHTSGQFVDVVPGQINEIEFNLSDLCKFSEIGTYRVHAECLLGRWLDKDGRTSEAVKITSRELAIPIVSGH